MLGAHRRFASVAQAARVTRLAYCTIGVAERVGGVDGFDGKAMQTCRSSPGPDGAALPARALGGRQARAWAMARRRWSIWGATCTAA